MASVLILLGRLAGALGIVVCVAAFALRLAHHYAVGGFQVITLLQAGIALLAIGCFLLLAVLVDKARRL